MNEAFFFFGIQNDKYQFLIRGFSFLFIIIPTNDVHMGGRIECWWWVYYWLMNDLSERRSDRDHLSAVSLCKCNTTSLPNIIEPNARYHVTRALRHQVQEEDLNVCNPILYYLLDDDWEHFHHIYSSSSLSIWESKKGEVRREVCTNVNQFRIDRDPNRAFCQTLIHQLTKNIFETFLSSANCTVDLCYNGGSCTGDREQLCICVDGFQGSRCQYGSFILNINVISIFSFPFSMNSLCVICLHSSTEQWVVTYVCVHLE